MALVGILTLAVGALTAGARATKSTARWQPPETIAAAARAARSGRGAGEVEAVAVDERLKLQPLRRAARRARSSAPIATRPGHVAVSCSGPTRGGCSCRCAPRTTSPCSCSRATCRPGELLAAEDLAVETTLGGVAAVRLLERRLTSRRLHVRRTQPAGACSCRPRSRARRSCERGALVTLIARRWADHGEIRRRRARAGATASSGSRSAAPRGA